MQITEQFVVGYRRIAVTGIVFFVLLSVTLGMHSFAFADREDRSSPTAPHDAKAPAVAEGNSLTTKQGVRIEDDANSLKAGARGPTLMEDFYLREKITQFDHERMPERVVHARGSGAHGYFQVYKALTQYSKAAVFADPSMKTPVFVRFSTVNGFR